MKRKLSLLTEEFSHFLPEKAVLLVVGALRTGRNSQGAKLACGFN